MWRYRFLCAADNVPEFPFIKFEAPEYATHLKTKKQLEQRLSDGERITPGDLRQTHNLGSEPSSTRGVTWLKKSFYFPSPFISFKIFCVYSPGRVFVRTLQSERAALRSLQNLPPLRRKTASCPEEGCTCLPVLLLPIQFWPVQTRVLHELPQHPPSIPPPKGDCSWQDSRIP